MKLKHAFFKKTIISCFVFLILFVFLTKIQEIHFDSIFQKMMQLPHRTLGLIFILALLQILSQGFRLWSLLLSIDQPPWIPVLRIFSLGQLVNAFLPARLGDVLKTISLSQTMPAKSAATHAGSVFFSDKLLDILSLFILALVLSPGLFKSLPHFQSPFLYFQIVGGIFLLGFLFWFLMRHFSKGWIKLWDRWLSEMLRAVTVLAEPRRCLLGLLFAMVAWSLECSILAQITTGLGYPLQFHESFWVLMVLNLGIAIPLSFANVGPFEAAIAFGLGRFGVPLTDALAIAGLHHLNQMCATVFLNLVFQILNFLSHQRKAFRVQQDDKYRAFHYYEERSKNYNHRVQQGAILSWMRNRERNALLELAQFKNESKKTMIDVGCGGGFYAQEAKAQGLQVTAVDFSPKMIDLLKGSVDDAWVADIETLSTPATYDIVVCSGVLDFVFNPEIAFFNLTRLLSQQGRLVIQVPREGLLGWIYRIEKRFVKIKTNLYSLKWFFEQAKKYDLKIVHVCYPLPYNMVLAFERLQSLQKTESLRDSDRHLFS